MTNPVFKVIPKETEITEKKKKWTPSQKKAIEISGGRVLVSAAAGSGKTAVLTARVIDKVKAGADISRFLIVTFTKAAAAEMRARIRKELQKELDRNPDDRHLLRQTLLVSRAKICTIDSFCADIVRKNFQKCGVSADFRICDSADDEIIKREALDRVFEDRYSGRDAGFERGVTIFSGTKNDDRYFELVYSLIGWLGSLPYPTRHMEYFAGMWNPEGKYADLYASPWFQMAYDYAVDTVNQYIARYEYALSLMSPGDGLEKYAEAMTDELEAMKYAAAQTEPEKFVEAVCCIVFASKVSAVKNAKTDEILKATVKDNTRDKCKDDINDLRNKLLSITPDQYYSDLCEFYPVAQSLSGMVRDFYDIQNELKSERNCWSFSDIAGKALSLLAEDYNIETGTLTPSEIALEMQSEYDFIMLDEYQDTNLLQDLIFRSVSKNEENLYCVGDMKQSIYRFRRAMPSIFLKLSEISDASCQTFPALVNLERNFRSSDGVIDFVNYFFGHLMSKRAAEIEYDDSHRLVKGASYDENDYKTKVVLMNSKEISDYEYQNEDRTDYAEGKACGREIVKLLESGRMVKDADSGEMRPMRLSDIAVLMRSVKNRVKGFTAALNDMGIAAYCDIAPSFYDNYEILFTVAFLETIDDPYKDMSLAAALRSPLFGYTVQELTDLTEKTVGATLYDKLLNDAENNDKSQNAVSKIEYYGAKSVQLPVYRLIWQIYDDFRVFDLVAPLGQAQRREENLRRLYKQAEKYENSSLKGLYGFLRYIEKSRAQENSGGQTAAPAGDYVRITSIHKSKGLEYPIVFLCESDRKFSTEDEKGYMLMHDNLGIGPVLHDYSENINYPTLQREAIKISTRKESLAEEMRLLYVAMTRAREKLYILLNYTDDIGKKLRNIIPFIGNEGKAPACFVSSAVSASDWIFYALMKHPCFADLLKENGLRLPKYDADFPIEFETCDISETAVSLCEIKPEKVKISYDSDVLDYRYPDEGLWDIPAKVSVSELKGIRQADEDGAPLIRIEGYSRLPETGAGGISAAAKGTAFHRFMQYIDLDDSDIASQAQKLFERGILTADEKNSLPLEHIARFFESPLADEMRRSKNVCREHRFLWGMPAKEYADTDSDKKLLVQGVIDMFYEDEKGGIVIVDYKTDRADNEEYFSRYALQLEYYARAISEITGKTVSGKVIYSVTLDKTIEV